MSRVGKERDELLLVLIAEYVPRLRVQQKGLPTTVSKRASSGLWQGQLTLKSLLTRGDCLLWVTYSGAHFLEFAIFGLLGAAVADEADDCVDVTWARFEGTLRRLLRVAGAGATSATSATISSRTLDCAREGAMAAVNSATSSAVKSGGSERSELVDCWLLKGGPYVELAMVSALAACRQGMVYKAGCLFAFEAPR